MNTRIIQIYGKLVSNGIRSKPYSAENRNVPQRRHIDRAETADTIATMGMPIIQTCGKLGSKGIRSMLYSAENQNDIQRRHREYASAR
nr:MAG TPA: hypothetical protein [Caudoviricetes sp.]